MRIGVDIDDTICSSLENMLPYICRYYNLNYDEQIKNGYPYEVYHSLPNYYEFAMKHYELIMPNAKLKDKADIYINKLKELGHEIIFITARSSLGFNDPYELSSQYLKKHNIPYDKLIVYATEKGKICREEDIDLFIDDSLKNCASVEKENIKVWLFDNYFNKKDNHFDRVNSWEEIYNRILNMNK